MIPQCDRRPFAQTAGRGFQPARWGCCDRTRTLPFPGRGTGGPGDFASDLNNLADLLRTQGKYDEAKPLFERAIAIHEKALGAEHPSYAIDLYNLALLLQQQHEYAEAKRLLKRALAIFHATLGPDHPHTQLAASNCKA
ncbi:MAG: tetratricopeptide repeat protein [Pseudomonadota bacterium]